MFGLSLKNSGLTFFGFFFLAGLLPSLSIAQEKEKLDSLNRIVNEAPADTSRISAMIELSRVYMGIDDDKALNLAKTALKKSEEIKDLKWTGFALNRLGSGYDVKSMPDSATACFLRALKIFEQLKERSGLAAVYQNIGVMHYYQKDFDKAFENYSKALELRRQTGEMKYVAQLYNNMGGVMRRKKEYDSAIVYYEKALQIKKNLGDKQSIASSFINISVAYQYKNDFGSAIDYIQKAIALCKETGNDYDLSSCYITLGEIYLKLNKTKEARQQAQMGLALAHKLKSNELLLNGYEELALCDTLAGDFRSAFLDYVTATSYKDEVYSSEKAKAISKMQTFYETEKKDGEIKLLNVDNETKKKQQQFLLIILCLSAILLIILLWAFLSKQKHNRILSRQKAEIENKTEQLKEQAAQIARLSSQMNPHFLFNALNSLQKFVLNKNEEQTLQYIAQLSALMRGTLNNSAHEHISLQEEVNYLGKYLEFEQTLLGTDLKFEIETTGLASSDVSVAPMLVQPLVENAIKHGLSAKAGEKRVWVKFEKENNSLKITVRDNGVGRKNSSATGHSSRALDILTTRIAAEYEKTGQAPPGQPVTITDLQDPTGTEVILLLPFIENF